MPRVSVIIPTYNRAHLVSRAIGSVFQQTYQDFEIIVIDDGSTDGTHEVIERIREPRLRYLRHDNNQGASAARNTGIEAASGDYIAFLDSDDEWLPNKLEKQVHLLQTSEVSVGAVYSGYVIIGERGQPVTAQIPKHRGIILDELLSDNCVGTTSTVMVRRECFRHGQPFDSALASGQDWDMWVRLAHDYQFDFNPDVLVRYHQAAKERISTSWRAVVEGNLRIHRKYANHFSRRQMAERRFMLGMYLLRWGYDPSYRERLRLGRQLFWEAVVARPFTLRYLISYFASFDSLYISLLRARSQLRALLRPLGDVRFRHSPKMEAGCTVHPTLESAGESEQPQQSRSAFKDRSKIG